MDSISSEIIEKDVKIKGKSHFDSDALNLSWPSVSNDYLRDICMCLLEIEEVNAKLSSRCHQRDSDERMQQNYQAEI